MLPGLKVPVEVKAIVPESVVEQSTAKGAPVIASIVIVFPPAQEVEPLNVKSSKRNVPVPDAPDNEITIVTVPVRPVKPVIGVTPINAPVVGTEPDPTLVPLIVIDQF